MNIQQKEYILNQIEQILIFDFDELILNNNLTDNVDDILYGEYKVSEFKSLYIRAFSQLRSELEEGLGTILPNTISTGNEYAVIDLYNEITNFYTYLKNYANKDNAADYLKRQIYYQIFHGFWDKSSVKMHKIEGLKIKDAEERIELVTKNLEFRLANFEDLKNKFTESQLEIDSANIKYSEELAKIVQVDQEMQTKAEQVDTLLLKTQASDVEISKIQKSSKTELVVINETKKIYEDDFNTRKQQFDQTIKNVEVLEKKNQEINDSINEACTKILAQEEQIVSLIGRAADGSLGYKFNDRKTELAKNAQYWIIGTGVATICAIVWVYLVFTKFSTDLNIPWINLLVNAIKTSPAWLLVGFCIGQYQKERNYQEQYAFKSAVAMTITSYSDLLSNNKSDEISVKESLLLQAVNNIYEKPTLVQEKSNVSEKSLEQAKGLLSTTVELIKNTKS